MSRKMTRSRAARTTALVASLSMALPYPVYAQSGDACADGSSPPCESQEGLRNGDDENTGEATSDGDGETGSQESQQEQQDPEPEIQPGETPEEVPDQPEPEVRPDPAPEQPPEPAETPEPAPEEVPQPDQAPEIPADGAEDDGGLGGALNRALGRDEPAEAEAPAAEEGEEPAAEEQREEPAAEDNGDREPAAEDNADREPAAEEQSEEPAAEEDEDALRRALEQESGEAPAEDAADDAAEDAPRADEDTSREASDDAADSAEEPAAEDDGLGAALERELGRDGNAEQSTEDDAAQDDAQSREGESQDAQSEEADSQDGDQPAETAEEDRPSEEAASDQDARSDEEIAEERAQQLMVDQPDAASGEPPAELEALAETEGGDEARDDVEVIEETVSEDTARSSSEDFDNRVNERRDDRDRDRADRDRDRDNRDRADANRDNDDDDDDDDDRWNSALSDREKVMLLGIGALAVGAVISNNRRVELNSGDRVVVQRPDGSYEVLKDDDVLLRQPGSNVRTEQFRDGSSRTTVMREDGSQIVTIYSPEMRVLRRTRIDPNGREYLLIDDTVTYEPVDVTTLPTPSRQFVELTDNEADLRAALTNNTDYGRSFSLSQIRNIAEVRSLVPVIDVNAITFQTGSAAITPDQAQSLASVGRLIQDYIDENPQEVFLIEGHTDAVGSAASNLALSDRRAESVALALTEYFDVPPENMVVQGYGESYLRVNSEGAEQANRRAAVRRITDLMQTASN